MRARPIACTNPLEVAVIGCELPSSVGLASLFQHIRMHVHVQLCMSRLPSYKTAGDLRRPAHRTSLYRQRLQLPPVATFRFRAWSQARAHTHMLYVMFRSLRLRNIT